jgi:hypothetical protein
MPEPPEGGGAAAAGGVAPVWDFAASTSAATMRPCGPDPWIPERSTPETSASRRASGEESRWSVGAVAAPWTGGLGAVVSADCTCGEGWAGSVALPAGVSGLDEGAGVAMRGSFVLAGGAAVLASGTGAAAFGLGLSIAGADSPVSASGVAPATASPGRSAM